MDGGSEYAGRAAASRRAAVEDSNFSNMKMDCEAHQPGGSGLHDRVRMEAKKWAKHLPAPNAWKPCMSSMERNGVVVARKHGSHYPRVVKINIEHGIVKLHPALQSKCVVLSINKIDLREMKNRTINAYLCKNVITSVLTQPDTNARFKQQNIIQLAKVNALARIKLEWNVPCSYKCGFTHLSNSTRGELRLCCVGGTMWQTSNYEFKPLPKPILKLFEDNLPHFARASSIYNNILAPIATGVENDHGGGFENIRGAHCVCVNGRIFHCNARTSNTSDPSGNLSYFTLDSQSPLDENSELTACSTMPSAATTNGHITNGIVYDKIEQNILLQLAWHLQQNNNYIDAPVVQPAAAVRMSATMQLDPEYHEVAQVTALAPAGNRVITVGNGTRVITMDSAEVEPLCYPLIFFGGEPGWGYTQRKQKPTFLQYLASRMLMPDVIDATGTLMTMPALLQGNEYDYTRRIVCNRFQVLSRLQQVYICDQTSRAIDFRLKWISSNQHVIFGGSTRPGEQKSLRDDSDSDDSEGSSSDDSDDEKDAETRDYLPSSFFGGSRYLKKKALNALAILAEHGKATFFLTMTCKTSWPEIQEKLLPGQTAYDRPDVTCMVFKKRLEKFLAMLEAGELFPMHGCKIHYIMRAIEFQHRGLPHAHIVFKLVNAPEDSTSPAVASYIDTFISAEMPVVTPHSDTEVEDLRYCELVRTHNIHKCLVSPRGCKLTASCPCKRGYSDDSALVVSTHFSELGYPIYRRRHAADRRVVPHSRPMIMAWDGHLNLEYAAGVKCALYLYSYLYKGPKSVAIDVKPVDPLLSELSLYLKARLICAMDAFWRAFGYQTYPASKPRVCVVKVKKDSMVNYLLQSSKLCDMVIYLHRPSQLAHLTYVELFSQYVACKLLPARCVNGTLNKSTGKAYKYFKVQISNTMLSIYLCERSSKIPPVVRIEMLYITAGDIWYLRLILQKGTPTSFEDAISHDGIRYGCYQQAAIAKGYVKDGEETRVTFAELTTFCPPRKLRSLFCAMLLHGFPMRIVYDHTVMRTSLMQDFLDNEAQGDVDVASNMMLLDFKRNLDLLHAKSLTCYGYDEPADKDTELDRELGRINKTVELRKFDELCRQTPNNSEQQLVFKAIVEAASAAKLNPLEESLYFFISGPGGVGKSEVCKKLHAYLRGNDNLIRICASTTLAATLFAGAETAHAAFKFPVVDDEDIDTQDRVETKLSKHPERLAFYEKCKVIFWHEKLYSGCHQQSWRYLERCYTKFESRAFQNILQSQ